jgi:hypothetical protein
MRYMSPMIKERRALRDVAMQKGMENAQAREISRNLRKR